jgi:nucleoside-diphosphate-sugar epimerase
MPAIVIGADTALGGSIAEALLAGGGEVRAFVTRPAAAEPLKAGGAKVAVGDVSDASHIAGAATGCFAAVAIMEAAVDDRERAFAADVDEVLRRWAEALLEAGVRRAIWVAHPGCDPPVAGTPEETVVATEDRPAADVVLEVQHLEEAAELP